MRIGQLEYFCSCLLTTKDKSRSQAPDHVVSSDKDGKCVYCGWYTIKREVNQFDINKAEKNGEALQKIKMEHLELLMKDRRHNDKVN